MDMIIESVKRAELNTETECCLEYKNVKHDLIEYKCLCCNKNYQKILKKF